MGKERPRGTGMLSEKTNQHSFLLPTERASGERRRNSDRLKATYATRLYVENIPDTKATFRTNYIEKWYNKNHDDKVSFKWIQKEMLWLAGSWKMPEHLCDGGSATRWVNPNYPHLDKYSNATFKCKCGKVFTRPKQVKRTDHNEGCKREDRLRLKADMVEELRNILKRRGLLARRSSDHYEKRLGAKPRHISSKLNLNLVDLFNKGREKRNNTIVNLINRGRSREMIAKAYNIIPDTVTRIVKDKTGYSVREIRKNDIEVTPPNSSTE